MAVPKELLQKHDPLLGGCRMAACRQPQGPPQPGGKGSLPCRALPAQFCSLQPMLLGRAGSTGRSAMSQLSCRTALKRRGEMERRVYSAQPDTSENGVFNADPNLLPLQLRESSAAGSDSSQLASAKHQELNSPKLLCYEITI